MRKPCRVCKYIKRLEDFYVNSLGNRNGTCKECQKKLQRAREQELRALERVADHPKGFIPLAQAFYLRRGC